MLLFLHSAFIICVVKMLLVLAIVAHLKMPSAEVVCCKYLPNITDELRIEANSVDSEQTAPTGAV